MLSQMPPEGATKNSFLLFLCKAEKHRDERLPNNQKLHIFAFLMRTLPDFCVD
jgi:hypothetical protein